MAKGRTRTGCLVALLLILALAVALVATCPKPADHRAALREVLNEAIEAKVGEGGDIVDSILRMAGKVALSTTSNLAIDRMVHVDNYYVVSIGRLKFGNQERIVSVGILNHVITPDKDDVLRELKKHGI
jgi:hypothetical protein